MTRKGAIMFMANEDRTALLPASDMAKKTMAGLEPGCGVPVEFPESTSHRDLRRHVFGVIGRTAKALNIPGTDREATEKLRIMLLMRSGRCHLVPVPITDTTTGKKQERYVAVVESMARQLMDEDELRAFYHDMRREILERILPEIPEPARSDIASVLNGE